MFLAVRWFYNVYSNNCRVVWYKNIYVHSASLLHVPAFFSHHQGGIREGKRETEHLLITTWMCFRIVKNRWQNCVNMIKKYSVKCVYHKNIIWIISHNYPWGYKQPQKIQVQIPENEDDILQYVFVCIQTMNFMIYLNAICPILCNHFYRILKSGF